MFFAALHNEPVLAQCLLSVDSEYGPKAPNVAF
jgi:hypothetical protein